MKITVGNFTKEVQGKEIADGVKEINVMDLFTGLQVAYTGNKDELRKNGFTEREEYENEDGKKNAVGDRTQNESDISFLFRVS